MCPNTTLNASVTCVVNDILTSTSNKSVCTLSIETTVCGFQSNISETVTAILKGILDLLLQNLKLTDLSSFSLHTL